MYPALPSGPMGAIYLLFLQQKTQLSKNNFQLSVMTSCKIMMIFLIITVKIVFVTSGPLEGVVRQGQKMGKDEVLALEWG